MPIHDTPEAQATRFLWRNGVYNPTVFCVDELTPWLRWIAYRVTEGCRTAVVAGREIDDWRLVRTEEGWPVPQYPSGLEVKVAGE